MKKIAIAIAAAIALVAAAAPASAAGYSTKQKNRYWALVKSMDSDANIIGKRGIIEFGIATCDLLRAGGTVDDIIEAMLSTDDFYIIEDLAITAVATAPVVLCKDQQYKFD